MAAPPLSRKRLLLSAGVGFTGVYLLVAVLAYFVSYPLDLPAIEGAPSPTPLNNPTGWLGAKIAHLLVYRGFGWIGILFPIALIYAALAWVQGKPIRVKVLGWGIAALYALSTFGGWLVRMGWVEDLIWCGSVGAGLTAWLSLYIGPVGVGLTWGLLVGLALYRLWSAYKPWAAASPPSEIPAPTSPPAPAEESWYYEVIQESPPVCAAEGISATTSASSSDSPKAPSATAAAAPSLEISLPSPSPEAASASEGFHIERIEMEEAAAMPPSVESASPKLPLKLVPMPPFAEPSSPPPKPLWGEKAALPPLDLLTGPTTAQPPPITPAELEAYKEQIVRTLQEHGIPLSRISATVGPTVTLYEVVPAPGIRISKIKSLEEDIALSLAALGIRIIAPIPGKGTIGIEVPHANPQVVALAELLAAPAYQQSAARLPLALGKTITGEAFVRDLTQMPHLLIAGATGQGKSVALNCMILALLFRCTPAEVRLVLIDPKKVEMSVYQGLEGHYLAEIPGLPEPIITDVRFALPALQSLVLEMEMRYELLRELQVRNLVEYNQRCLAGKAPEGHKPLPYIVVIIDELADLMMTAGKEVEAPICRLAQLARAVGLHLIVATQRPSVNVITGLIKANFPVRISFRVASRVDSRVILDMDGAERLIGRGDMLFAMGTEVLRLQSGYVSTAEIERVIGYIAQQPPAEPYVLPEPPAPDKGESEEEVLTERDPLFYEAARLVVRTQQGSTSLLQRRLGIGYNRAGRLMEQLEKAGIVGPARGSKPREVLVPDETHLGALLG
ncbi:MAG: DNA translocase FtsK [Bacteroidia bacterium]|nr:DNA translocase FtsK [Bacteroidia bacterium]MDW8088846.1 DNA translocase FtsK 4TM domain-containing protein [Bacteroidia bacterium]